MTESLQDLLDQALKLSAEERAALVADLLASLDGNPDPQGQVEAAWTVELRLRLDGVRAGEPGLAWETVREEIKARLKERRDE